MISIFSGYFTLSETKLSKGRIKAYQKSLVGWQMEAKNERGEMYVHYLL